MLKTYLYLPDDLNNKIKRTATTQNKSKAAVIRVALEEGLNVISKETTTSAQALLRITEVGKRHEAYGPTDLSAKLDHYLWETNE